MRRYTKTAREKLRRAFKHVLYARRNLGFGILLTDFQEQREILATIEDQILNVLKREEEE